MAVSGLTPGETTLTLTAGNGVVKTVPVTVRDNLLKDWQTASFSAASNDREKVPSFTIADGSMTLTGVPGTTDQRVFTLIDSPDGFNTQLTFGLDYTGPELANMGLANNLLMAVDMTNNAYAQLETLPVPDTVTPGHYRLDVTLPVTCRKLELRIGVFTTTPFTVTRLALMKTSEFLE